MNETKPKTTEGLTPSESEHLAVEHAAATAVGNTIKVVDGYDNVSRVDSAGILPTESIIKRSGSSMPVGGERNDIVLARENDVPSVRNQPAMIQAIRASRANKTDK